MKPGDKVKHITGAVGVLNRMVDVDTYTTIFQVFDGERIYYAPRQEWERVEDVTTTNEDKS